MSCSIFSPCALPIAATQVSADNECPARLLVISHGSMHRTQNGVSVTQIQGVMPHRAQDGMSVTQDAPKALASSSHGSMQHRTQDGMSVAHKVMQDAPRL